jgi:hypothetical protein
MVKLQKIHTNWFITDSDDNPHEGAYVIFNGILTIVTSIDVENRTCLINIGGMSKNIGFESIEVVIRKIDEIYLFDFLSSVNRLEVIDEKGRSYVKYLAQEQKVELSFQDSERTLKVFVNEKDISK